MAPFFFNFDFFNSFIFILETPFKFDYKIETTVSSEDLSGLVQKVSKLLEMYRSYPHTVDLLDSYRSTSELTSLDKVSKC